MSPESITTSCIVSSISTEHEAERMYGALVLKMGSVFLPKIRLAQGPVMALGNQRHLLRESPNLGLPPAPLLC